MKKINENKVKLLTAGLLLSAVYGILSLLTCQACGFTYCQPQEPDVLKEFWERRTAT